MIRIFVERIVVQGLPGLDGAALERGLQAALGSRASARPARTQEERLAERIAEAVREAVGGTHVE